MTATRLSVASEGKHPRLTAPIQPTPATRPALSILHVLAPSAAGGLESVVHALATGQVRSGHAVGVIAIETPGADVSGFSASLRAAHVDVRRVVVGGRGYIAERRAVSALCRGIRPDVVHTHGYRPDVVHGPAIKRLGIPTVSTVHGLTNHETLKGRFFHWLQARALREYDAVAVVSRPLVHAYTARGISTERLHCVPNGWGGPAPLQRAEARSSLGLDEHDLVVGWIGRLSVEKGADVFLDAIARVARRHSGESPLKAIIIGDGPERETLRARARTLGLIHNVEWLGIIPGAGRLAAAFDVVVLSSRSEGTPIALLEAMAAGTPVVATNVGGVPDVVTCAEALLVPPDEPRALAAAIDDSLHHRRAAYTRAAAARQRLERDYDLALWLSRYEHLYHAVRADRALAAKPRLTAADVPLSRASEETPTGVSTRQRQ